MFGSRHEPYLMNGRKIVWRLERSNGMPLNDVLAQLVDFESSYDGNKTELVFGYWEYGDEIVVTAPDSERVVEQARCL
jgi:hypothetical protein